MKDDLKTPARDAPNPGGRPKADEPGTSLTTWVPLSEYDRLCRMANHRGETLSSLVRQMLKVRHP